jgi:hypothetical protein
MTMANLKKKQGYNLKAKVDLARSLTTHEILLLIRNAKRIDEKEPNHI